MRRTLLVIVALVGICSLLYSTWARYRLSGDVLMNDRGWPRAFPYPDTFLLMLNDAYDRRYPAPRGSVKLHGELDRVIDTVWVSVAVSTLVTAVAVLTLAWPGVRRHLAGSRRGFDVTPGSRCSRVGSA